MPIALESGALLGRGVPAACAGSSSAGQGSSSQAEAVHLEESEESEGEVQSSLRGPFDTMDALQEALPRRRESSKIYNAKPSSLASARDVVLSPQSSKGLANPENPSPKKRKGPLPFSIDQNESQSKELNPVAVGDINNSPTKCRMLSSPAATSSSPSKSRKEDEHECCTHMPCHNLQRELSDMNVFSSPPVGLQTQPISVSTAGQQDVGASTDVVSPREKRRKN
ncbi:hypothetical protein TRIUR3_31782 [Triticum urartu]|uniref:Uncharacterized protein n=1 Tax=Triticum urartu TaxID=4572 RepID=M7Z918_TRIUA|nr:uncharacterized protein LOC125522411 [Triticum urartu]EMS56086.1 hypothetical protein TRIUR3_31782 [Triticum urartu]